MSREVSSIIIILTFCLFIVVPPVSAEGQGLASQTRKAYEFLNAIFDEEMNMTQESPITFTDRYWTTSDNLWLLYVFEKYGSPHTERLRERLINITNTYNFPNDTEGLPISYKHELVDPTPLDRTFYWVDVPMNESMELLVANISGKEIWASIQNDTDLFENWDEFTDMLCYASLYYYHSGQYEKARHYFAIAAAQWDGKGMYDKAISDPKYGTGVYESYKMGLLLYTAHMIHAPLASEKAITERIFELQDESTWGFYVNYYPNGTVIHDTNTETNCIIILANPHLPLPPNPATTIVIVVTLGFVAVLIIGKIKTLF